MPLYGFKDRQIAERCKQLAESLRTTETCTYPTGIDTGSRIFIIRLTTPLPAASITNGTLQPGSTTATVYELTSASQSTQTLTAQPRGTSATPLQKTVYNITQQQITADDHTFHLAVEDSFGKLIVVTQKEETVAESAVLCKVVSGDNSKGYEVSIYANGRESDRTGTGKLFVSDLAMGADLPTGAWVLGHFVKSTWTGGNDE